MWFVREQTAGRKYKEERFLLYPISEIAKFQRTRGIAVENAPCDWIVYP